MKPSGKAVRLGILTATVGLLSPVLTTAQPTGETAKPDRSKETESMMQGAPNQDATLRGKNAVPGAPVEGTDLGIVKSPPKKSDQGIVERPPANVDPGIHTPGGIPKVSPTKPR